MTSMKSIYLIGSLRNPKVVAFGTRLRAQGFDVFDDWASPGPETDDCWQAYEKARGRTFAEALKGHHAKDVYNFDKSHLDRCDIAVLMLPAGKSGHLELGYVIGKGKPGYILLDGEPERYDIMYQFATGIFTDEDSLIATIGQQPQGTEFFADEADTASFTLPTEAYWDSDWDWDSGCYTKVKPRWIMPRWENTIPRVGHER